MSLKTIAASFAASAGLVLVAATPAHADVPDCTLGALPVEASETVDLIQSGGPFPHDQDGTVFQNREGILPDEETGHYHEYTVETPGSDDRGARRIVAGGEPVTDPETYYYTGDHYSSFCEVTDAAALAPAA